MYLLHLFEVQKQKSRIKTTSYVGMFSDGSRTVALEENYPQT